jgi:3-dehydroquinate synthase
MPTQVIYQRFTVPFSYPVYFTRRVFSKGNRTFLKTVAPRQGDAPVRILLVVDDGVVAVAPSLLRQIEEYCSFYHTRLTLIDKPVIVTGGEHAKNGWGPVREIMTRAGMDRLDRHSYIVAIGGGCVLDMAGFAASLIHRGVRFIRIPTTVLAQNDAGVGVKNGMNDGGAKNFIGTFAPPYAVINDFEFLKTLSPIDWVGGISEAFKVAIIADKPFFYALCKDASKLKKRNQAAMERLVQKTAVLHLKHIATHGDPFEFGSARPLDFGHWAAHRLELDSNFSISHGHAVAIGIALDSTYAMLKGMITGTERDAILKGLQQSGLPTFSPLLARATNGRFDILEGIEQFREHLGGKLSITLPCPLGAKREVHTMDSKVLIKAIEWLRENHA